MLGFKKQHCFLKEKKKDTSSKNPQSFEASYIYDTHMIMWHAKTSISADLWSSLEENDKR